MPMNWDVTEVKVIDHTALRVRFHDGLEGEVKFLPSAFRGVFTHLSQPAEFIQAYVQQGVLTWPGELDLAPEAMHEAIAAHGQWILD